MRRNVCMMRCWPAMRPVKPTRNRRPLRSRPDFCSSVTDTSAQNVLTAMALGEQLFDELSTFCHASRALVRTFCRW